MSAFPAGKPLDREAFDRLVGELRPKLHRYCARMTGSVLDGEDVVHEAIVKATEALSQTGMIAHPEAWLFRIAHNAALDFLRHRARQDAAHADEDQDMIVDPLAVADDRQVTAASRGPSCAFLWRSVAASYSCTCSAIPSRRSAASWM